MDRGRSSTLVGRETELTSLGLAASGDPVAGIDPARLVLVSGDAGVGKTRLLSEFLGRLEREGWRTLVGHCLDVGDVSIPYLPFGEMLEGLEAQEPERAEELYAVHPALALLRRRQRGAHVEAESLERAEILESVHALLDELSVSGPVVMVVEDAHWAEASTRDLLGFLLSRRFRGRCLCVVSFRSDEMHRRHPLRGRVAEWIRQAGVERVPLEPLSPAAVRDMVTQILGTSDPAHDADVERIVQRAQGNAFYVEELVGAFLGGGGRLPDDLADLLLVRLDRLDDTARSVVRIAAAAGQRVSHDVLGRVVPVDEDTLDFALRAAVDAHVLVSTGAQEYAFRHALLGEAAYDDLLPGERMRLHRAYAEAIGELRGCCAAADMARHALASHDLPAALMASIEAGEQAMAAGGPDEAARHYSTALEIHERAAEQLADPPDEVDLVARTCEALSAAGRPEMALALVDAHLQRLAPDAPPVQRASLLLERAEALRAVESDDRPSDVSGRGLELVGPEPAVLRARLLAAHAPALVWEGRMEEARVVAEEAIELADQLGLPRLAADVGMTLTWLTQREDEGARSRAELRRIIDQARRIGDPASEVRAHLRLGSLEYEFGLLEAAEEAFLRGAEVARTAGRPWAIHGIASRTLAGLVAVMRGDHARALAIADHRAEDPPPTSRAQLQSVELAVAAAHGDVTALDRLPSIRERWHREGMIAITAGAAAIELHSLRDGAAAAVATYDDVCRVLVPLWGPWFDARVRLAALAVAALAAEAAQTPTTGREEVRRTAERLAAEVEPIVENRSEQGRPFGIEGDAWHARLKAELRRLDWLLGEDTDLDDLVGAWQVAQDRFGALGHRLEQARADLRLGEVLRAAGDAAGAREHLRRARAEAHALGARSLVDEVDVLVPAGPAGSGPVLTPREREILELVAEGRSNPEIGQRLFISPKTASVHVSNLMAKLGAASRTEAVALARRTGLLV